MKSRKSLIVSFIVMVVSVGVFLYALLYLPASIPENSRILMGRLLTAFLASDDSSYCTGSEFVADGGLTAGYAGPGSPNPF